MSIRDNYFMLSTLELAWVREALTNLAEELAQDELAELVTLRTSEQFEQLCRIFGIPNQGDNDDEAEDSSL